MMSFVYTHEEQKKHRKCGGVVVCVYSGHGDWDGRCDKCGQETKACQSCLKLKFPPVEAVLKPFKVAFAIDNAQKDVYRCLLCGIGFGEEKLYLIAEHMNKSHETAKPVRATEPPAPKPVKRGKKHVKQND
jgi:hypothetical protein